MTMPKRRIIEDSDDEDSVDKSPVRQSKPAEEESPFLVTEPEIPVSAIQSTGSTEVLNRDIQDAYHNFLEPSTTRSSRSSHPSSGSPTASKGYTPISFGAEIMKKPKVTYGAKKNFSGSHLGEPDDKTAHVGTGGLGTSTSSKSKTRKRAVSELESCKIVLGEEVPPSSSAPAESPSKRARIDNPSQRHTLSASQMDSDRIRDELSLSVAGSPESDRRRAKSQNSGTEIVSMRASQLDGLGSDDLVLDLPTENYQPRPSRSRSTLTTDELVIPEDFSKRPEALAKSQKKLKRRKTTAFEEPSQNDGATFMQQQSPSLEGIPQEVSASMIEPTKELSPQPSPPRKKSRGRPKKDAAIPEQSGDHLDTEQASMAKEPGLAPENSVKKADPPSVPSKRGRKRKKPKDEDDANTAKDVLPETKTSFRESDSKLDTERALTESDPNIRPSNLRENELPENVQADTDQDPSSSPKQQTKQLSRDASSSPVKLKAEDGRTSKASDSAKQESKSIYRVGLSKRQRIPSLLRVVRK
ncbi:MAG: hypothetical protein Q9170_005631 [Blastenia crenularia]